MNARALLIGSFLFASPICLKLSQFSCNLIVKLDYTQNTLVMKRSKKGEYYLIGQAVFYFSLKGQNSGGYVLSRHLLLSFRQFGL